MERSRLGGMGGKPVGASLVVKVVAGAISMGILWMGCTDPFAPVEPQAPTSQVSQKGSLLASSVPSDFFRSLDSGLVERTSVLLDDSASMESDVHTMNRTSLFACASNLASWKPPDSSVVDVPSGLSLGTDTVIERFSYSIYRSRSRIVRATATWTVVRIGTEWKLQHWSETAQDSGWYQLCQSPR